MKLRLFFLLIAAAACSFLIACGSSSHPVSVAYVSPPTTVSAAATAGFTVTVANGSKGVTWSLSCTTSTNPTPQCGTLVSPAALTVTYQAPVSVLTGTVTLTATSVDDVTKSAVASFAVGAPSAITLPDGNYVFQLSGQDTNGTFNVAGAFTLAAGAITTGEEDFTDSLFVLVDVTISSASTITATTDGNLQIVLATNSTKIGVGGNGLETLNLAMTSITSGTLTTGGLVNWFDAFATGAGQLSFQNAAATKAAPGGGYAFVASGGAINGCAGAFGGVINVDNNPGPGSISGAGSVIDTNICGTVSQKQTLLPGSTFTGPDSLGRVLVNFNPASLEVNYAGYVVSSSKIVLVETADELNANTGGTAYSQGSLTGGFTSASLTGNSYVVTGQGSDANGSLTFAAALTFNSDGSTSGTADFNDIVDQFSGTAASPSASYTVDATGRVTLTGLILKDTATSNLYGPITLQLYLDGAGNAVSASMDNNDSFAGPAFQQTTSSALAGNYALNAFGISATTFNAWSAVGQVATSGSGITDSNYLKPTPPIADVSLSGFGTSSPLTITGLGADSDASGTPTSDTFDIYVIDANRAFGVETDNVQLGTFYTLFQN
ncbi:MAG TPA: hypothetical protein VK828_14590 [Terriglobales bacterium]|jgi:hypothetical protein|nr:hypothetical protein [Terriglobales bacterium]